MLLSPNATFPLAVRLREQGAPIGDVFAFLSGLYFRGKLAYARAFEDPPRRAPGILVITTDLGMVSPDHPVSADDVRRFATVDLAEGGNAFLAPMRRDTDALARRITKSTAVILLGSIATGKYVDVLTERFRDRVVFPGDFVGRGDMSRGGLLLRCIDAGTELDYVPVLGAIRRGRRPPKLDPRRRRDPQA